MEIYEIENILDLTKDDDLLSVTYQTINLGDGSERGTLAVCFEGNSDNAGRTVRYHFKDENGTRYYLYADEIESIEQLQEVESKKVGSSKELELLARLLPYVSGDDASLDLCEFARVVADRCKEDRS